MDRGYHILYSRYTGFGTSSNGLKAKIDRLVVGRVDPEYFPEPQLMNELMRNVHERCTHRSEFSSMNFRQICVFPMPPIPYSKKDFLRWDPSDSVLKKARSFVKWSLRPVKCGLEGALGLYSIFGKEIVLGILGISSNLTIRAGARNISSMHTGRQACPDVRYKIPLLAVIVLESVEFDLV